VAVRWHHDPGMTATPATTNIVPKPGSFPGNLSAEVRETHTGVVVFIGDKAYKAKKSVVTDFLDFSTPGRRERACVREHTLNSRLSPESYLGIAHLSDPQGGPPEPVIVMRRYSDSDRLASLVKRDRPVHDHLLAVAETLARYHSDAARGAAIDDCGTVEAIAARWQQNLGELKRHADSAILGATIREVERLATEFISGRAALFAERITARRILDGHADLIADDIFCLPAGPALLDCLEFDDLLRYVDGIDDAAFLAMDLEFLGRKDLGDYFLTEYSRLAGDTAPRSLKDFYIAYRAVVRAKVDCVRVAQGHPDAAADAQRHMNIALEHLRAGTVRLIVIGGGPGTGKTTLANALSEQIGAQVISTDNVRRELQQAGTISGSPGVLNTGLYAPDNVSAVYDEVRRRARLCLKGGQSVILDGTWRDPHQRERARCLADEIDVPITEFTCVVPQDVATTRIQNRAATTSDATAEVAAALADDDGAQSRGFQINTGRALSDSVAEAEETIAKCL
jgi:uncharacterized protein